MRESNDRGELTRISWIQGKANRADALTKQSISQEPHPLDANPTGPPPHHTDWMDFPHDQKTSLICEYRQTFWWQWVSRTRRKEESRTQRTTDRFKGRKLCSPWRRVAPTTKKETKEEMRANERRWRERERWRVEREGETTAEMREAQNTSDIRERDHGTDQGGDERV